MAGSLLAFASPLKTLLSYSFENEHYSHIVLVPVVSIALVYLSRKNIFAQAKWSPWAGTGLIAAGLLGFFAARMTAYSWSPNDYLSLCLLSIVTTWLGFFLLCYGPQAWRAAVFPLLFLYLMVPIPDVVLQFVVSNLVQGSAEVTGFLFRMSGTPVYRDGPTFFLPGVAIRVAEQCSGIRSSMALLITALLAGHLFLRDTWRKLTLLVAALPILVVKNGVRIVTITLLAVHVDPGFLTGRLHRIGGMFFFALGLVLLWPVLRILEKTEKKPARKGPGDQMEATGP